jgi:trk system potassium uptake protein TrkH
MTLARVAYLIGAILRWFGLALLVPAGVAVFDANRTEVIAFVFSAATSTGVGLLLRRIGERPPDLRRPDALAVVAFTYLVLGVAGALPYLFVGLTPIDALFESMSGITTTGATVLTDFSRYGHGILFWRALSHWLGGMGVITLFVAVLPKLAIGGRDLFFAEASGPTEETLTPQIRKTAAALWWVYLALTAVAVVALLVAGLPLYDAIVHAFATVAAGGFSPHPQSVMGYQRHAVEWTLTVFMFLAGANFALHYRVVFTRSTRIFRDEELVAYAGLVAFASAAVTSFLVRDGGLPLGDAVRLATFQVVSVITSTGFATADFATWDDRSRAVLLTLMFVGGCAGSAAGGLKIVRVILIARYALQELRRTLHPRAVLPVKLGGRVVPEPVMRSVLVFFLLYLLAFVVVAAAVTGAEGDVEIGVTGAIGALANGGPGFGAIGPMGSYAGLTPVSKVVLITAMWLGRLELLTVLVFLGPRVWHDVRWRSRIVRTSAGVS